MNNNWKILHLDTSQDLLGPILSVKRLKDGKVFTVGDPTFYGPINSFKVSKGIMTVQCGKVNINGYDGVSKSSLVPLSILE